MYNTWFLLALTSTEREGAMEDPTSTSTIFLLLSALVTLGRFAAFAQNPFGSSPASRTPEGAEQGDKHDSQMSTDGMPVSFREGPLGFTRWALKSLWLFLNTVFAGPQADGHTGASKDAKENNNHSRVYAFHILLKMLTVSAFVILGVFVFSNALDDTAWRAPADGTLIPGTSADGEGLSLIEMVGATFACFAMLIAINAIFETISLLSIWWSLRPFKPSAHPDRGAANGSTATPDPISRFAWRLPVALTVSYICFYTTLNVAFSAIITLRGIVAGYPLLGDFDVFWQVQWVLFWQESLPRLLHPIAEGSAISVGNTTLLAFCVLPLLPAALLLVTLVSTLVLDTIDLASNGSVTDRLANKGKRAGPVFSATLVLSVIGSLAALIPASQ